MKIESKITDTLDLPGHQKAATVVIEAFDESDVKITLEIEVKYDSATTIPEIKKAAKESAVNVCGTLIRELESRGYF